MSLVDKMTEITHEHLELAALAAGHEVYGWCMLSDEQIAYADIGPEESVAWGPHTDIGDAALLAVKLGVIVQPMVEIHVVHAWVTGWKYQCVREHVRHDGTEADKARAYCHAVTLCAAEIGRRMKEAK